MPAGVNNRVSVPLQNRDGLSMIAAEAKAEPRKIGIMNLTSIFGLWRMVDEVVLLRCIT
jgi:hypothetical protein